MDYLKNNCGRKQPKFVKMALVVRGTGFFTFNIIVCLMNNLFIYRTFLLVLVFVFSFTACTQKEDAVMPQENCDTVATVQYVPSCGLQLLLENNQILVPVNATYTTGPADEPVFKINGFPVKDGQRIIVGYKPSGVTIDASPCNVAGYHNNKLVEITCIVGLEQGT
jgi:hypothetical protein